LECSIHDWVKIVRPWKPKSFAAGDYIVDCDETLEGGWGPSACRLTHPNGATLFGFWYDDEAIDSILLQHARRTLNPGDVFYYTDPQDKKKRQLRLRRYTSTGMFASEVNKEDLAEIAGRRVTRGARKRKRPVFETIAETKRKLSCVKYSLFMFLLLLLVVGSCFYFFFYVSAAGTQNEMLLTEEEWVQKSWAEEEEKWKTCNGMRPRSKQNTLILLRKEYRRRYPKDKENKVYVQAGKPCRPFF
jgi:hypothetical protein